MFKVESRKTWMTSIYFLYCWLWTYFTYFSSVSVVNCEQENADWEILLIQNIFHSVVGCININSFMTILLKFLEQILVIKTSTHPLMASAKNSRFFHNLFHPFPLPPPSGFIFSKVFESCSKLFLQIELKWISSKF